MLRFHVCSRHQASLWNPLGVPHLIISISTPGSDYEGVFPKENEFTKGVLSVAFCDLDRHPGPIYVEQYGEPVLFDENGANNIANFVAGHLEGIQAILVHCDLGLSRSPAVAAALSRRYNADDSLFFRRPYSPNMFVYRTLLNVLMDEGTKPLR